VKIVSVAVAAVEVERQTVAVLGIEVPARRGVVVDVFGDIARRSSRHGLVAVARSVTPPPVAASPAVRRSHCAAAGRVAVVLRREVVAVASAAAVHERPTLSHRAIPVESQVLVEARAGLFRQQASVCEQCTELPPGEYKVTETTGTAHLYTSVTYIMVQHRMHLTSYVVNIRKDQNSGQKCRPIYTKNHHRENRAILIIELSGQWQERF